jgi:hypothetical protein
MASGNDESQELESILAAVKEYNAKWDGNNRMTRLTLLLAMDNEPIMLLAGPPLPKTPARDPNPLH